MALAFNQKLNGIAYRIPNQMPDESFGLMGADGKAKRIYICAWSDRLALREAIVGAIYMDASGNLVFIPVQTHPDYPGLLAQGVEITPLGKPTGPGQWAYAQLTATFAARSNDGVEEQVELCGETFQDDGSNWKDESGNPLPSSHAVNKSVSYKNYRLIYYQAAELPGSNIDALYGLCNSSTWNGYAAHTVVYQGYQSTRRWNSDGQVNLTITHHFLISPIDVRKEFINGKWQLITNSDGGYKYDDGNFSPFKVSLPLGI